MVLDIRTFDRGCNGVIETVTDVYSNVFRNTVNPDVDGVIARITEESSSTQLL